jgi:hypothetical protein
MTEAQILNGLFNALQAIMTVVSLFFAIVSGYIAALYFFLGRATFFLRALAFSLLTIGLVFLGGTALVIQSMQEGLLTAWGNLSSPVIAVVDLRNPLPLQASAQLTQQELGVGIGWAVGITVYLALAYLTFLHDWSADPAPER